MWGCTSDKSLVVRPSPPSVIITKPADMFETYPYRDVAFEAEVSTRDGSEVTEVEARWVGNDAILRDWESVNSDGVTNFSHAFTETGEVAVTVTVRDARSDTAMQSITVIVKDTGDLNAPTIVVDSPADGAAFAPESVITFRATVSDVEDAPELLEVTMKSDRDGVLPVSSTPDSDGVWVQNVEDLSPGVHLITLSVYDTHEMVGTAALNLNIDGEPTTPVVSISPNPAPSGEPLVVNIDEPSIDPEGADVTYSYQWYVDEVLVPGAITPGIEAGRTMRAEYWRVEVTPSDGEIEGTPGVASVTIENSAPRVDGVTLTPSSPRTGDDILATASGWFDQDGDSPLYRYNWTHNGELDPDETTDTFPLEKTVRGDELRVTVVPRDAFDDGEPVTSSLVVVENTPPAGGGVIITPEAPEPTDDLLCTVDVIPSDDDGDPISYTYTWYVDGVEDPGLTGPVVDSLETSNLETWTCEVTPFDGFEEGASFSDTVNVSDGTAPPPPDINPPAAHRNKDAVDLTGYCEAGCVLDFYCSDTTGAEWTVSDTCTSEGTFGTTIEPLVRGESTTCFGTCTDEAGNISGDSSAVSTEVCDPEDIYENSLYGDSMSDPIDEWSTLPDDGTTTINIIGNVLDEDEEDWYVITAGDDLAADLAAGRDEFNFQAAFSEGTSEYSFVVYRDDPLGVAADSCMPDADGYTEYSWFNQDSGDAPHHALPSDLQACGSGSALLNDCADDTADFYIHVFRNASSPASCQNYQIQVTNGVW